MKLPVKKLPKLVLDDLKRSGLTAKDAAVLRVEYIAPSGFLMHARYRLPYFNLDGTVSGSFSRDRYLDPLPIGKDGRPQRYRQNGKGCCLYLPPLNVDWTAVAADPTVTIYITEGEKKAACACKHGLPTIGLGGVDNWRGLALAQLDCFELRGRDVKIIYDSDAAGNPNVERAERQLAAELNRCTAP